MSGKRPASPDADEATEAVDLEGAIAEIDRLLAGMDIEVDSDAGPNGASSESDPPGISIAEPEDVPPAASHSTVPIETMPVAPTDTPQQDPQQDTPEDVPTPAGDEGGGEDATKRTRFKWPALWAGLILIAVLAGVWYLFSDSDEGGPPLVRLAVEQPITGDAGIVATQWVDPAAVAANDDAIYVLDRGNNRILAINDQGEVVDVLCETGDCAFLLSDPQAMRIHADKLYVANTGAAEIVVLTLDGSLVSQIPLPADEGGPAPEPTGLAFANTGLMFVSDGATDRVLRFGVLGDFSGYLGEGLEDDARYQLSDPAGLTVDFGGNLYVSERGNGRVQKFSPAGRLLTTFWMAAGDPDVSTATDVAVAEDGTVFFSDTKRSIVHVFSQEGRYLGILGLLDATRRDSPGVLREPVGLDVVEDRLFVIDAREGLYEFEFDSSYWFRR